MAREAAMLRPRANSAVGVDAPEVLLAAARRLLRFIGRLEMTGNRWMIPVLAGERRSRERASRGRVFRISYGLAKRCSERVERRQPVGAILQPTAR
jgi:hypothetical protein